MDIRLLLAPDFLPRTKFCLPPMGIATLAASLRQAGHRVSIDDLDVKSRSLEPGAFHDATQLGSYLDSKRSSLEPTVESLIQTTKPITETLVGLSVVEPSQLAPALCLAKRIKEQGATVVLGGRVSVNETLMKHRFVDYVISGDAETSFPLLVRHLEGQLDASHVPGLAYRGPNVRQNPVMPSDIKECVMPDFTGLDLDLYRHNAFDTRDPLYETYNQDFPLSTEDTVLMLPYLLTKGCGFSCSFCAVSAGEQSDPQLKTPSVIAEELSQLKRKHRTPFFFFMDSTLNSDERWLDIVCDNLNGLGILWSDSATPRRFANGLLDKMTKAGCVRLTWGVESLSDPVLQRMRKPFNAAACMQTLRESDAAGIWNYTNWIAGFPHEKEEDILQTVANIRGLAIDDYTVTGYIFQASDMQNNPERYGIRPGAMHSYLDSARDRMETSLFDEIDGLSWQRKQEQIDAFRQRLNRTLAEKAPRPLPMHTVFYLYEKFQDKEAVKRWLKNFD